MAPRASYTIWPYDCVDTMLHILDASSVHCVVTSPPYFGLRDYGHGGQLGHEAHPDEYVARLVQVGRAIWRVLRDDGTFWLNLGDSYATDPKGPGGVETSNLAGGGAYQHLKSPAGMRKGNNQYRSFGLKKKDLLGIPWRVALALQADGWYLRQAIVWAKPNPMPESTRDRCTKSYEMIFMLTKRPRYFYDADAIAEKAIHSNRCAGNKVPQKGVGLVGMEIRGGLFAAQQKNYTTRNKRDVWTVSTKSFKGAHFATFPPDLIEPCILAGSPTSCCAACGAPRVAKYERTPMVIARSDRAERIGETGRTQSSGTMVSPASSRLIGYEPSCRCGAPDAPALVLDPFGGSGTTALVALRHGRNAVLCELNPEYIEMAHRRIAGGK